MMQRVTSIDRMPVRRGAGRRKGRLLPRGGRRRVHPRGAGAERGRPAQSEDPLFAAARRGGVGGGSGAARSRFPRRRDLWAPCRARRRLSQRAQTRGQSREPRRLRRHDRTRQAKRGRVDLGDRSGLRPARLRRAAIAGGRCPLDHVDRQPAWLAVGRFPAGQPPRGRHAFAAPISWSRRWSPRN